MSSLEQLPVELHMVILRLLPSWEDLYRCIRSSRTFYQAFRACPHIFLITQLKKSISPAALPYALTLHQISRLGPCTDEETVQILLCKQFRQNNVLFPFHLASHSGTSLTRMMQQHNRLMRFIKHFASSALSLATESDSKINESVATEMQLRMDFGEESEPINVEISTTLPCWAELNHGRYNERHAEENSVILSSAELARLQRAFYTYELYCQVVPVSINNQTGSLLSLDQQRAWFLSKILDFETEEMATVHQYFMSMAGKLFDEIENEFVNDVLDLTYAFPDCPTTLGTKLQSALQELDGPRLKNSSLLWNADGSFCLQSYSRPKGFDDVSWREASLLASRGAKYFEDVLSASKDDRLRFLKENLGQRRTFISDALNNLETWVSERNADLWNREDLSAYSDDEGSEHRYPYDKFNPPCPCGHCLTRDLWIGYRSNCTIYCSLEYTIFWPAQESVESTDPSAESPRIISSKEDPMAHNKGWHDHSPPDGQICLDPRRYSPLGGLGHVFWDAQRLAIDSFKKNILKVARRDDIARRQECWPRSRTGANTHLCGVSVNNDAMAEVIEKYRPILLLGSWQES